jgi:hypothetical protein
MALMARLFVLALLVAVSLDFSMPDAVLSVAARSVQWDDEEESVPARRQRMESEVRRVVALPGAPRLVESAQTQPSAERRVHADRLDGRTSRLVPIRHALMPSVRSASPSDDH